MFLLKKPKIITASSIAITSAVDITGEGVQPVTFNQFGQRVITGIATQYAVKAIGKAFKPKNYHPKVEVGGEKYNILPYDKLPDDVPFMKSSLGLGRDVHKQYKFLENLESD